jgi:hypothetical protein
MRLRPSKERPSGGSKLTQRHEGAMSALPPKADKEQTCRHVRLVPMRLNAAQNSRLHRSREFKRPQDASREPDREGRKNDVENDGEGELQPGNKEEEIHEINPRTSVDEPCAVVTLIRREWPMDTAETRRAGPSQARLRAIDRDVSLAQLKSISSVHMAQTHPPFQACRYRCDRGSRRRTGWQRCRAPRAR